MTLGRCPLSIIFCSRGTHPSVDVVNENPLSQPTLNLSPTTLKQSCRTFYCRSLFPFSQHPCGMSTEGPNLAWPSRLTPCTLHPKPYTLHPKLEVRHSEHGTLHPQAPKNISRREVMPGIALGPSTLYPVSTSFCGEGEPA